MAKKKEVKKMFITMTDTLCEGTVPAWKDEKGNPVLYETERKAWEEIADSLIQVLQEFIDGDREQEETDFEAQDWVEEVDFDGEVVLMKDGTEIKWIK